MTLDNEEDRGVLLQIIQSSSIPGGAVLVVASLVERLKNAEVLAVTYVPEPKES